MRKIEQQMNAAIREGRDWQSGNAAVTWRSDGEGIVTLHMNVIARVRNGAIVPDRQTFRLWPTRTTSSRLQALGVDACIRRGVAYIDGKPA